MGTKIIISVTYIILILLIEIFIEKRLNLLKERHQQKIWWWYASGWLWRIHTFLIYIIRILLIMLWLAWSFLTFTIL